MTIETILIINSIVLGLAAIALTFCVCIWLKAEKKAAYYKQHCSELQIQADVCEDRVKAAYELGYKESKSAVQQKTANECYEKILEWHPVTKTDKYSYSQFIELFEQWLKEKYGIEVKDGE